MQSKEQCQKMIDVCLKKIRYSQKIISEFDEMLEENESIDENKESWIENVLIFYRLPDFDVNSFRQFIKQHNKDVAKK